MNRRSPLLFFGLSFLAVFMMKGPSFAQQSSPFGDHVFVFSPKTPHDAMQKQIDDVYAEQQHSEFGTGQYAFLFLPGEYKVDVPIGFYTQVLGLGARPDDVHIASNVHVDAAARNNNATTTFWRAAEGFSVTPTGGTMQWAVSQAVALRRMHVLGNIVLHQNHGWASGGWMSDTKVDGNVDSGSQQQWISRNAEWKSWTGANWNMVFVGTTNAPAGEWPDPPYTKIAKVPIVREKPFLQVDSRGHYSIRVPTISKDTAGVTWSRGATPGRNVPLSHFYIAHPERDTATSINAALANGKDLLLLPGTFDLTEPIQVVRKNTVVYGLGFATLHPTHGTAAMTVADVDGVTISGLLFDAGEMLSPVLLQVGEQGSHAAHAENPTSLHDVFFRVGGPAVGKVTANLVINSNDVIVDHTWIWRADHGNGVGWASNMSANGLVVNGNDVTIYGLFVEHHQQYQVLWNGNHGRTFFYQSEIPYDPPDQQSYKSPDGSAGWASYKVGDAVTNHEAWGMGIYSVFRHLNVNLARAIETPVKPGIHFHHMITVALGDQGEISNVIDDAGGPTQISPRKNPKVDEFPLH